MPARRRLMLVALLALALVSSAGAGRAVPVGVYGNVARFDRLTGQHTDSGLAFIGWDQGRTWGKPYEYFLDTLGARPHIVLKTERSGGTISTQAIALGRGEAHLIGLAQAISDSEKPVLLRPLGEMNNTLNPYCACRRDAANSTKWFRRAFQRIYIVMHGGSAAAMSARLRALGMPGVSEDVPSNPYPKVTVVWNPLAVGEPPVRGNGFRDYFPGGRFFDVYGNDYYNFGTYAFVRTTDLYKAYPSKPFVVPEWGLAVDDPGFIRAFAGFVKSHRRITFIGFYNGKNGGRLDLARKPGSLAAYKRYIVPLTREVCARHTCRYPSDIPAGMLRTYPRSPTSTRSSTRIPSSPRTSSTGMTRSRSCSPRPSAATSSVSMRPESTARRA
ncbi:MAG: hypothetical protein ABI896_05735 [Actinomycetota bacterium]